MLDSKEKLNKVKPIYAFVGIFGLAALLVGAMFYIFLDSNQNAPNINNGEYTKKCLHNSEFVTYEIEKIKSVEGNVKLSIQDSKTGNIKSVFAIDNVFLSYHPIEIHNCNIYVIKEFNWDSKKSKSLSGFSVDIWRYNYNGEGGKFIQTAGENSSGDDEVYYSRDFRVNSTESHIVLIQGYLGSEDYALILKNLETKNDDFIFPITKIQEKDPELVANLQLVDWAEDGRYFWARTHVGAYTVAFIRVDSKDWSYEIFEAPQSTMGGDALNLEKGVTTVHPDNIWIGVHELTEQEKEKRRQEGIGSEMHVYNLFTKEDTKIIETDEPLYFFKPKWISDTELQYEMPDGEVSVYELK